jgi:hypothetical protein
MPDPPIPTLDELTAIADKHGLHDRRTYGYERLPSSFVVPYASPERFRIPPATDQVAAPIYRQLVFEPVRYVRDGQHWVRWIYNGPMLVGHPSDNPRRVLDGRRDPRTALPPPGPNVRQLVAQLLVAEHSRTPAEAEQLIRRFPEVLLNGMMHAWPPNYRAIAMALEIAESAAAASESRP